MSGFLKKLRHKKLNLDLIEWGRGACFLCQWVQERKTYYTHSKYSTVYIVEGRTLALSANIQGRKNPNSPLDLSKTWPCWVSVFRKSRNFGSRDVTASSNFVPLFERNIVIKVGFFSGYKAAGCDKKSQPKNNNWHLGHKSDRFSS